MKKPGLLAASALLLLPIRAPSQSGMIRGKVRAANGVTVNNATVELKQTTGGVISQVTTRNDGDFEFTGLRAGDYEVHVSAGGYEPAVQVARLIENIGVKSPSAAINEVINLEINIKPRPEPVLGPPGTSFVQAVPDPARSAYAKGLAKIRDGKSDEGIAFLRQATAVFDDYFDAHFALGVEFYRQGKDADAIQSLERARLINDRQAAVYYMFGMVMVRQQKFGVAEYAFGKTVELNPNYVPGRFNHGVALIEVALRTPKSDEVARLLGEAERELDRAWDLSARRMNTVFLQRSRIYQKRGDKEAAARELETYLKAEPAAENAAALRQRIAELREGK
jgi:tetratricopeptide (TPR) repeat protein